MATKIRSRRYCQPSVHDYVCRKVQCGFRAREIQEGVIRGEGVVARQDRTTEARRNVRGVRETDGINPSNLEKSVGRIGWGVAVTAALRAPRGASFCEERDNLPLRRINIGSKRRRRQRKRRMDARKIGEARPRKASSSSSSPQEGRKGELGKGRHSLSEKRRRKSTITGMSCDGLG